MVVDAASNYRPYTPIDTDDSTGTFELLVRNYPRGDFSSRLVRMEPGDEATFLGPVEGRYRYQRGATPELGLIAAGTGIAPMWQVIQSVLSDPHDQTRISLVYASRSHEHILLKDELDRAAAEHPGRLRTCYVVSQPSPASTTDGGGGGGGKMKTGARPAAAGGSSLPAGVRVGRIDEELLRAELPAPPESSSNAPREQPGEACHLLVSGPEPMLLELCGRRARDGGTYYGEREVGAAQAKHPALGGMLRKLGYRSNQVAWL